MIIDLREVLLRFDLRMTSGQLLFSVWTPKFTLYTSHVKLKALTEPKLLNRAKRWPHKKTLKKKCVHFDRD